MVHEQFPGHSTIINYICLRHSSDKSQLTSFASEVIGRTQIYAHAVFSFKVPQNVIAAQALSLKGSQLPSVFFHHKIIPGSSTSTTTTQTTTMVSFSPKVSVREYERILDIQSNDTFLGLAIGWKYNESTRPTLKRRRNQTDNFLPPAEYGNAALHWGERLEVLRSYGFSEKQLDSFWTASRKKAVDLDEQEEQQNQQVNAYITTMLGGKKKESKTKDNKKKDTNKRARGWLARRGANKQVASEIDSSSLHRSPRFSKQRRRGSPLSQ